MKTLLLRVAVAAVALIGITSSAAAGRFFNRSNGNWHADYYEPSWAGTPHALVVPPTVKKQFDYSWGAPSLEMSRIRHQYSRGAGPLTGSGNGYYAPAPVQPTHTRQMGVYYIRAPW